MTRAGGARLLIVALLAIALVVFLTRGLLQEPAESPGDEVARGETWEGDEATLAPRGSRASPAPGRETSAAGTPPEPLEAEPLPAGTKFQQRLALGAELFAIRSRLGTEEVDPASVLPRVRRRDLVGRLALDAWEQGLQAAGRADTEREAAHVLLDWMVDPRRDPEALRANESDAGDPALRVWTLADPFPPRDVEAGAALLRRLREVAGDRSSYGYDVVATPQMGRELFGKHTMYESGAPAAGLYTTTDDLCLIRTVYESRFQGILLKHELVHAWAIRQRGLWTSRFLEEGLAEYLSRWLPADPRLGVPPQRFANEFASLLRLLARLDAYRFGVRKLSIPRLLEMGPLEFYGLGRLGYQIAQAAVAYAGADAVEAALRDGSDWALRSAMKSLTWKELVAFLHEHARGGHADEAVVIEDLATGPASPTMEGMRRAWARRKRSAMRSAGIAVPPGFSDQAIERLLDVPARVVAQDAERLRQVLRRMGPGEVVVATEVTAGMGATCRWDEETLAELAALVPDAEGIRTRADLAERLVAGVRSLRAEPAPQVLHWGTRLEEGAVPLPIRNGPVRSRDLLGSLWRRTRAPGLLVVCLASRDGDRETVRTAIAESRGVAPTEIAEASIAATLRDALASSARRIAHPPAAVLVVDLADGQGDAEVLASAFANALGKGTPVALWNPQRPVR